MQAYRTGAKLKLGLIAAAVAIALASLWWTNRLADRLAAQEQASVELWVRAIEYQAQAQARAFNPYLDRFDGLDSLLADGAGGLTAEERARLHEAVGWARTMPPSEELDFVFNQIVEPARFSVPAIITDSAISAVIVHRNVRVDSSAGEAAVQQELLSRARQMDAARPPIRFEYLDGQLQLVHYGESDLARLIRRFPYVQLLFVALFILVGYLGFSYVRRNEQSSLWVGMAKEAAHQLGTPLSSLIGWIELLRLQAEDDASTQTVADELEHDVERLKRVADRFEKIGSVPALAPTALAPVVERVAGYMRRRIPQQGRRIALDVAVPAGLWVLMNVELFEWVVENLLKNALDAIEGDGRIAVEARRAGPNVRIAVRDTGKGIERAVQRMIFRPGFSTKKRGWGLGLSLARRIVESYHGGRLDLAESRAGVGTTFVILLRAAEPEETAAPEATARERGGT